jgi:hypothetical protein
MEIRRSLFAPCGPDRLFAWVEDLAVYPQWMRLVHHVEPATDVDGLPAWQVELRAQVGPFARSKVLRMVRTEHDEPHRVTFERSEVDGRQHSPWTLSATIESEPESDPDASILTMQLRYGGSLWSGAVLQRVLDDAVRRGSERLLGLVSDEPTR